MRYLVLVLVLVCYYTQSSAAISIPAQNSYTVENVNNSNCFEQPWAEEKQILSALNILGRRLNNTNQFYQIQFDKIIVNTNNPNYTWSKTIVLSYKTTNQNVKSISFLHMCLPNGIVLITSIEGS